MSFGNLDSFDMAVVGFIAIAHLAMWLVGIEEVYRCAVVAAMIGYIIAASRTRRE